MFMLCVVAVAGFPWVKNVLEVNETFLIVRPDDGPIGPKHVA